MVVIAVILAYFILLFGIGQLTSRRASNSAFYSADHRSPWPLVAFGMVGASISGVTFVSVPGMVTTSQMTYLQVCLGFIVGYIVVAMVLLPLYYKLKLTSIYTYLGQRLGPTAYKTGAWFFLLSKLTGAALKFYVVCLILQQYIFSSFGLPFEATVLILVLFIWLYTHRGGIRTLVFTDVVQTLCLLFALILIIYSVIQTLHLSVYGAAEAVANSSMSQIFVMDDWQSPHHFCKQFLSGVFIVIVMTGLDQDMMQKNLTCRTLRDAQKDMCTYGLAFLPVNLLFLSLGVLLTLVPSLSGMGGDQLLPAFVSQSSTAVIVLFTLGIVAASFSSADSALTTLTTSYCIDISSRNGDHRLRRNAHLTICILFAAIIIIIRYWNSPSLIDAIYTLVGYTYGPLLGLFAFGLFTHRMPIGRWVPWVCLASPLLCLMLSTLTSRYFNYQFGYELLMFNGILTFAGLWVFSTYASHEPHESHKSH